MFLFLFSNDVNIVNGRIIVCGRIVLCVVIVILSAITEDFLITVDDFSGIATDEFPYFVCSNINIKVDNIIVFV